MGVRTRLVTSSAAFIASRRIETIHPTHVELADYVWTLEGFRFANVLAVSRTRSDLRDRLER
jgi:hypothetical protein